jgi:hypothetical protein
MSVKTIYGFTLIAAVAFAISVQAQSAKKTGSSSDAKEKLIGA